MRILQVAKSSLPPGGQSHVVHHLSDALARRGHEVTVLALRRRPSDRASLLSSRSRAYSARLLRLPRTRGLFHDAIFTRAVRRLAVSGRFDLVHAHMLHPEGTCALRALSGLGIPLVVTGHGEDIQIDPSCNYGIRLDPRVDRSVRRVLASADALIAIGEAMKNEMTAAGADRDRVSVIQNGYHVARAREPVPPDGAARDRSSGYILSVGRLVRKKGYDLLLRAMRSVVEKLPEARLVIAGEGPMREELERSAEEPSLRGRVEFAGFVAGADLRELYEGASLFVCPSRWEPLGLVNLEAMACGLPVVAFRIDGIPGIVKDGVSGLLAAPEDPDALASAIVALASDERVRGAMSDAAREAARPYRWEAVAERHERLYERVLARAGRAVKVRAAADPPRVA